MAESYACSPKPRSLLPGGRVAPSFSEKLAEPTSCHQPISFPDPLKSNPHLGFAPLPGGKVRGRRKAALLKESRKQAPRAGGQPLKQRAAWGWQLRKLGQGWRLPRANTKPLPWSWALGELLESRGDLEELQDAHQATLTQRGQAGDADHPQEGKTPQEPRFW